MVALSSARERAVNVELTTMFVAGEVGARDSTLQMEGRSQPPHDHDATSVPPHSPDQTLNYTMHNGPDCREDELDWR